MSSAHLNVQITMPLEQAARIADFLAENIDTDDESIEQDTRGALVDLENGMKDALREAERAVDYWRRND